MLVDVLDVELAGGSFHHDPFLVVGVELVHEKSWKIYVDGLIWSLETLGLDDHSVGIHHADVLDFMEVIGYEKSKLS